MDECGCACFVQSAEVTDTTTQEYNTDQGNVAFSGGVSEQVSNTPLSISACQIDKSVNVDLSKFLSRPVLINSINWEVGSGVATSFEPWFLYFNHPSIKKKLDNYAFLRCNLHLKFVINASPFYYSCLMASYRPLSSTAADSGFNAAPLNTSIGSNDSLTLMGRSQRPRVFIYPQNSEGAEMHLPFFYHQNWLESTSADALKIMGVIHLDDMEMPLTNANSVAVGDVDVQIYAWTSELELAGPTVALAVQSCEVDDEYQTGPISGPASAITNMANKLSTFPIIGNFATATSMISSGIGKMASLFGYTNVPVIADVHAFKSQPFPHMATTQIGVPCEKLTLDPKNELSIDPKINGIDVGDELSINSIITRESFLGSFVWTSTQITNDLIWNAKVAPNYSLEEIASGMTKVQGTPAWMVSKMFNQWRGDMTYRIKFLCTKYHRGRVRISWDPDGPISLTPDSTTEVYNRIVDITEETDVEFTVPYTQATSYLFCPSDTHNDNSSFLPLGNSSGFTNGVITLRVLNAQTSPIASADIRVLVFAKCSDNFEFADPRSINDKFTPYQIQSAELEYGTPVNYQMGYEKSSANEHINLIHNGEKIVSLRQIMRRQNYVMSVYTSGPDSGSARILKSVLPRMPLYYGYDTLGLQYASPTVGGVGQPFNFALTTTLNWVNQCFVAHKGSVNWNINLADTYRRPCSSISVTRAVDSSSPINLIRPFTEVYTDPNNLSRFSRNSTRLGQEGFALTNQQTQSGINVSVPMYNRYKFVTNNILTRSRSEFVYAYIRDTFTVATSELATTSPVVGETNLTRIDYYCGIGTDFSSIFFLNVPTQFVLNVLPASLPTP